MKAFMKSKTHVLKRWQELDASETQMSNAPRYALLNEGDWRSHSIIKISNGHHRLE